MKIGIIGIVPPPYGGISIHISRLKEFLEENGNTVNIIDEYKGLVRIKAKIKKKRGIINYLKSISFRYDIFHYHSPHVLMRFIIGFASIFRIRSIITLHGEGIINQIVKTNPVIRFIYILSLKKIDFIICDNNKLFDFMLSYGFQANKMRIISAFIPPKLHESDYDNVPKEIWEFYKNYEIKIFGMAWVKFFNGVDLYGLDMILGLIEKINNKYEIDKCEIGFIIKLLVSDIDDIEYYQNFLKKANSIRNLIVIINDIPELYPLEKEASIVIRPSYTDGDSLSIRESLYFGVPVITSDAVPRPEGCILFKNRDLEDFENKVSAIINAIRNSKCDFKYPQINNAQNILDVYYSLL